MIPKKNPKYDLEKNRKLYLNLGLLVAGSLTLAAFKYVTPIPEKTKPLDVIKVPIEQTFEFREIPKPEKQLTNEKPSLPEIPDENRIKEVDKKPDLIINSDVKFPEFEDFYTGNASGPGIGDPDPVQTIDIEDVESYPEFTGGDIEMMRFIQRNFRFPKHSYDQGTIYVRFVVSHTGQILDATIARGVSPELDKEALRIVNTMPHWVPGKFRGRNVNVRMVIPIKIRYQ